MGGPAFGFVPYVTLDRVAYTDRAPWPAAADGFGSALQKATLGGYGNEPQNWVAAAPTPGLGLPTGADSDSDGLPDEWEARFSLNVNSAADAHLDSDSDGLTNLQEYRAGTSPRDSADSLRLGVALNGAGAATLSFQGKAGKAYSIQATSSLSQPAWATVQEVQTLAGNQPVSVQVQSSGRLTYWRVVAR